MSEGYDKKTRPSNLEYFTMRMKNSGYRVERIFTMYSYNDPRVWTVIIDPGQASIVCTCYVNRQDLDDTQFEFYDGGQFIPSNMKIKTSSVDVLITHLVKYGINNKDTAYPKNVLNPFVTEEERQ